MLNKEHQNYKLKEIKLLCTIRQVLKFLKETLIIERNLTIMHDESSAFLKETFKIERNLTTMHNETSGNINFLQETLKIKKKILPVTHDETSGKSSKRNIRNLPITHDETSGKSSKRNIRNYKKFACYAR